VKLGQILDLDLLKQRIDEGYVRQQHHPREPLRILNYSQKTQWEQAWDDVTRQCRGLIVRDDNEIVARPWVKFFNWEEHTGEINLDTPVRVFAKLDGSLGVLYPISTGLGWAIATRGSFMSEQAIRGSRMLLEKLQNWSPNPNLTYLWEVIYDENRIVVNYGGESKLVLLDILETETGLQARDWEWASVPEPWVDEIDVDTLEQALTFEPGSNAEGIVLRFDDGLMLKQKTERYVHLHRILTGTNARNVWETAAVKACRDLIKEPKHWGSYLGIDPERAAEILVVGDDWLEDIPDEFHLWVKSVLDECRSKAERLIDEALELATQATPIEDRRLRYESVKGHPLSKEIMRYIDKHESAEIVLRAWREACPEPTSPFNRSEDVA
jgi:hypothetical protein